MSDLTIPIIGLTALVGYFFSTKERNPKSIKIDNFENPKNDTIYNSNKYEEVNKEVLLRSLKNYKDAENPSKTGVLPPLYNTYSSIGSDKIKFHENDSKRIQEADKFNKISNVLETASIPLKDRPMFTSTVYLGTEVAATTTDPLKGTVSLLTGLPLDTGHDNMTPFFGSNVKQNIENFTNNSLLEGYTGNQANYVHKKEVSGMFENKPENIYGTPIFTNEISTDRYIPSLIRSNEKPFESERIEAPKAGTIENEIKPSFKKVEELRVGNVIKETYKGRTVAGQMGEVRGVQSDVAKQRPETFYQKTQDHLFKTTGEFTAQQLPLDFSTNFKATARKDYNIEYVGGANKSEQFKTKQRYSINDNSNDTVVQPSKRLNYENTYAGNIVGKRSVNDFGKSSITPTYNERASTEQETHVLNVNKSTFGVKSRQNDLPKNTLKETVNYKGTGHVKTIFDKGLMSAFDSGLSGVEMKPTHKESTLTNNYKGIINKQDGMGYLVNKYEAKTTGKETVTNNSDYKGNAAYASESTSRQLYVNADIRDNKETLESGERPSGPQSFRINNGKVSFGDTKSTENMLLKEQEERRPILNHTRSQIINSKNSLGYQSKFRFDNDAFDTVASDRLQPDLVSAQHSQNPFSIYGK